MAHTHTHSLPPQPLCLFFALTRHFPLVPSLFHALSIHLYLFVWECCWSFIVTRSSCAHSLNDVIIRVRIYYTNRALVPFNQEASGAYSNFFCSLSLSVRFFVSCESCCAIKHPLESPLHRMQCKYTFSILVASNFLLSTTTRKNVNNLIKKWKRIYFYKCMPKKMLKNAVTQKILSFTLLKKYVCFANKFGCRSAGNRVKIPTCIAFHGNIFYWDSM